MNPFIVGFKMDSELNSVPRGPSFELLLARAALPTSLILLGLLGLTAAESCQLHFQQAHRTSLHSSNTGFCKYSSSVGTSTCQQTSQARGTQVSKHGAATPAKERSDQFPPASLIRHCTGGKHCSYNTPICDISELIV